MGGGRRGAGLDDVRAHGLRIAVVLELQVGHRLRLVLVTLIADVRHFRHRHAGAAGDGGVIAMHRELVDAGEDEESDEHRRGERDDALRIYADNLELLETRFRDDYTDPDPLLAETLVMFAALAAASGDFARATALRAQAAGWAPGSVWARVGV